MERKGGKCAEGKDSGARFPESSTLRHFVFLMGPRIVSEKGIKGLGVNLQRGFRPRFIWSWKCSLKAFLRE